MLKNGFFAWFNDCGKGLFPVNRIFWKHYYSLPQFQRVCSLFTVVLHFEMWSFHPREDLLLFQLKHVYKTFTCFRCFLKLRILFSESRLLCGCNHSLPNGRFVTSIRNIDKSETCSKHWTNLRAHLFSSSNSNFLKLHAAYLPLQYLLNRRIRWSHTSETPFSFVKS